VVDVKNAWKIYKKNISYIYNKKPVTESLLNTFVWDISYKTWDVKYSGSGYDMSLILWQDYLLSKVK